MKRQETNTQRTSQPAPRDAETHQVRAKGVHTVMAEADAIKLLHRGSSQL